MIKQLTIIGVGLIGGSLALALRRAGAAEQIVGCGRSSANLDVALELGIVDTTTRDVREAVSAADMVVVAADLGATPVILAAINDVLPAGAVVTDVGSSKGVVVAAARAAFGPRFPSFVAGHPIAGTEHRGARAAFADLYIGHKVILTPVAETDRLAYDRVRTMWLTTGATVIDMDVDAHDRALAATSHLPHLLAYALVDALAARGDADRIFEFAAGGFRDFTRIASSNPQMWSEIALANRAALVDACRDYATRFEALVDALEAGDGEALLAVFQRAQQTRDSFVVPESNASK